MSAYVHNSMMLPTLFPEVAHMFPDIRDHSTSCKDASGSLRTKYWHGPQVRVWFYLMRAAGFRCETEKGGIIVSSGKAQASSYLVEGP